MMIFIDPSHMHHQRSVHGHVHRPKKQGSRETNDFHPTIVGTKRKAITLKTRTADTKESAASATTTHSQAVCTFKSVDLTLDSSSNEDNDGTLVTNNIKPSHLFRDADLDPLCITVSCVAQQATT
uniref:Uncharacterized protein n=1 Tax=Proboscia inermis TaxID=420281 RepID=A0A7S0CBS4_9STRA